MPKNALTVGDVKTIEEVLEMKKNASDDVAVKEKIDELIKKPDSMEIRAGHPKTD